MPALDLDLDGLMETLVRMRGGALLGGECSVYSITVLEEAERDADLDLAERIVRKAVRCCESKPVTVEDIIQKVCNHYEIEESAIHTKTRKEKWYKYVR